MENLSYAEERDVKKGNAATIEIRLDTNYKVTRGPDIRT